MPDPAYPAARAAAIAIYPHFARHFSAERTAGGLAPDVDAMQAIMDAAFWASLRREEGYVPRISLAFVRPEQVADGMLFEQALPLAPQPLTRIAPAVERPGIHLGVCRDGDKLTVWGATRHVPAFHFVLEVAAPGLLVVKYSRGTESTKFVNVAVLEGDQIKIVDQRTATLPDCPNLLMSLLGLEKPFAADGSTSVWIQMAVSMRAHGRGGSLLIVPAGSRTWQESILRPITYAVAPPFAALAELTRADPGKMLHSYWEEALRREIDGIAGLTAVDGAAIMTDACELLAFGAKIVRRPGAEQVERVLLTEPIEGSLAAIVEPGQLGGTRHLSAAQFAHDQRDAIALVASQDGHFTVFGWSACEETVHAHRIETLLL
jgi:hypothetical protein